MKHAERSVGSRRLWDALVTGAVTAVLCSATGGTGWTAPAADEQLSLRMGASVDASVVWPLLMPGGQSTRDFAVDLSGSSPHAGVSTTLSASGTLVDQDAVHVKAELCKQPWTNRGCGAPEGAQLLAGGGALMERMPWAPFKLAPGEKVFLRVTATLDGDAPESAGNRSADVSVRLVASAVDGGGGDPGKPDDSGDGGQTGKPDGPGDSGSTDQPVDDHPAGILPGTGTPGVLLLLLGLAIGLVAIGLSVREGVRQRGQSYDDSIGVGQ